MSWATVVADLATFPAQRRRYALVTDFDGTLAPIVDDPAFAQPLPEAVRALRVLAPRLGLVGVVSGRTIEFLRVHLPVEGIELAGQYGAERLVDGKVVIDARVAPFMERVEAAAVEAESCWPELLVERKGGLAVTIHWRTTPEDAPSRADLDALADRHGLSAHPARRACELRPPIPIDKGTALEEMFFDREDLAIVIFAGDDLGDLAAYDALDRWQDSADRGDGSFRVGVRSAEAPAELLERADVVVDGPVGFAALLGELAAAVSFDPSLPA